MRALAVLIPVFVLTTGSLASAQRAPLPNDTASLFEATILSMSPVLLNQFHYSLTTQSTDVDHTTFCQDIRPAPLVAALTQRNLSFTNGRIAAINDSRMAF